MKNIVICCLLLCCCHTVDAQYFQPQTHLLQKEQSACQIMDLSLEQSDCNYKTWAIVFTSISGISLLSGTFYLSYAIGYDRGSNAYYNPHNPFAYENITSLVYSSMGLVLYAVSIGTGISSVILFRKSKKKSDSMISIVNHCNQLFPNGIQCQMGVQPSGFGLNIIF